MRTILSVFSVLALAAGSTGCKEYFSVEEACHPDGKFRNMGIDSLNGAEVDAINRMNCYRRLVGFDRYGAQEELQQAGENMASYVTQNPDIYGRTQSSLAYLLQEGARPGFSGTEIWERLDVADYSIPNANAIRVEQVIGIVPEQISGAEVVDEFMRVHWIQETVITPSPYEVAYVEATLDAAWWQGTGLDPEVVGPLPETGTFIYMIVSAETPPTEGAGETPITYPKQEMEGVPLTGPIAFDRYIPDVNADGIVDEFDATQLSYPITVGYTSSLNPQGSGGSTPFDLVITSASIQGPDGPLETVWASPGEAEPASTRLDAVSGIYNYWAGGVYATEPFRPSTTYRLYLNITTTDGPASHEVVFYTSADDEVGQANGAGGTTARSVRGTPGALLPTHPRFAGRVDHR